MPCIAQWRHSRVNDFFGRDDHMSRLDARRHIHDPQLDGWVPSPGLRVADIVHSRVEVLWIFDCAIVWVGHLVDERVVEGCIAEPRAAWREPDRIGLGKYLLLVEPVGDAVRDDRLLRRGGDLLGRGLGARLVVDVGVLHEDELRAARTPGRVLQVGTAYRLWGKRQHLPEM